MIDHPQSVRIATMADMDALVNLCVVMHKECSMHGHFAEDRVREGLKPCLDREGGVVGAIDDGSQIAGAVSLFWGQHWYTHDWHWFDRFLYVRPSHRSENAWDDLSDFAKWFVDQVSPPGSDAPMPLAIGVFQPPGRIEALCRLYRRKFVQVGGTFVYGNTSASGRIEVARG